MDENTAWLHVDNDSTRNFVKEALLYLVYCSTRSLATLCVSLWCFYFILWCFYGVLKVLDSCQDFLSFDSV